MAEPDEIVVDVQRTMTWTRRSLVWIGGLLAIVSVGAYAYTTQLRGGLARTGLNDYVSWGLYITNFVFFIGVSHAGTLISAILRVTHAEWRRPVTRMAEAITVFALMVGAPMVLIDMGRPDRIVHVFEYGRFSSPILWDVVSITTYLTGSLLYLYVAMIPDLALLAARAPAGERPPLRYRVYRRLSLGYQDLPEQRRALLRAIGVMAVVIIPVAISVHTVVSWIFGMTLRPGWHSTIFGPYFVVGAIFSGTAALIVAMAVFRRVWGLDRYLTFRQFRNLGTLLLALDLVYIYFTLAEYLTSWYGGESADDRLIDLLMGSTAYGAAFWTMAAVGLFVPLLLLVVPVRRSITPIVIASVLVNIGMFLKRYLIVVPTMLTPFIEPGAAGASPSYWPTWVEWSITAGAFAAFLLAFTLFGKLFPILSIWEIAEAPREDTTDPPRPRTGARAAIVVALLALTATSARAEQAPAALELSLRRATEDHADVVLALVLSAGQPVEGVAVKFYVRRTFGLLSIGTEETLDDGTAAVPFPARMPGGPTGELDVTAIVEATETHAAATARLRTAGGLVVTPEPNQFPRALWAPRAPLGLLVTILGLAGGVWLAYVFVITQLVRIRKGTSS